MKRFWFALLLLFTILGVSLWNAHHLNQFTATLSEQLLQAEELTANKHWEQAELLITQARESWHQKNPYLHVTLRHSDTDQIEIGFDETLRLLRSRETGEYAAATARLTAQLRLVSEAELLNLENLF